MKRAIRDHIDRSVGKLHLTGREKLRVLARDKHTASPLAQRGQSQSCQFPIGDRLIQAIPTLARQQLYVF